MATSPDHTVFVGEHISEFIPAFPVILSVPALCVGEHILVSQSPGGGSTGR